MKINKSTKERLDLEIRQREKLQVQLNQIQSKSQLSGA
jgi:hypothetical protein